MHEQIAISNNLYYFHDNIFTRNDTENVTIIYSFSVRGCYFICYHSNLQNDDSNFFFPNCFVWYERNLGFITQGAGNYKGCCSKQRNVLGGFKLFLFYYAFVTPPSRTIASIFYAQPVPFRFQEGELLEFSADPDRPQNRWFRYSPIDTGLVLCMYDIKFDTWAMFK